MTDEDDFDALFSRQPGSEALPLCNLGYVSTQSRPLAVREMLEILSEAQRLNAERGLTGILLHKNGSFFQVLEGHPDAVARAFASIEKDPRHKDIQVIFEEVIEARDFSDWRMGFMDLDTVDPRLLSGYTDLLQTKTTPREFLSSLDQGHQLALMFKQLQG